MSTPIKLVMLGESGVGKTSVITRYITGSFPESAKPTIGAAFLTKEIRVNDNQYDLMIWDTAGQEEYRGLAPMYYRNALVAIVMFDVSNEQSFTAIDYWLKDLKDNAGPDIGVVICANKIDTKNDRIAESRILDFAKSHEVSYVETSALTGEGVEMLFQTAVTTFTKNKHAPAATAPNTVTPQKNSGGGCC